MPNVSEGRYEQLLVAWNSLNEKSFDIWVMDVSDAFYRSKLNVRFASTILGVRLAELQAALALAVLDEEELVLLAKVIPPKTTWFSLATASAAELNAAVGALQKFDNESPFNKVEKAIKAIAGPSSLERVGALSSEAFEHAAKKATNYEILTERSRNFLKTISRQQRTGKGLTSKQAAYAKDLLMQLADAGAIVRNSRDNDVRICDQILDAIGRI